MIIKIARANGNWLIFGEVSEIVELAQDKHFQMYEEIKKEIKEGDYQLFEDPDPDVHSKPIMVGETREPSWTFDYIKFVDRCGNERLVMYQDGIGYICNDNGKTIERI